MIALTGNINTEDKEYNYTFGIEANNIKVTFSFFEDRIDLMQLSQEQLVDIAIRLSAKTFNEIWTPETEVTFNGFPVSNEMIQRLISI